MSVTSIRETREEAEDVVRRVKGILRRKDDLIYSVDVIENDDLGREKSLEEKILNGLSGGHQIRLAIEVIAHNVSSPNDIFEAHEWASLGEMGLDIETYDDCGEKVAYLEKRLDY